MRVVLLTSGKVEYRFGDLSLFDSIRVTALGERFPHIVSSRGEVEKAVSNLSIDKNYFVVSATSAQTKETAAVIGEKFGVGVTYDDNFLPLRFNLSRLVGEKEFYDLGDNIFDVLRTRFLNAFYENRLIDKHKTFKNKYQRLIKIAQDNPDRKLLVISHSYLIQLFSIYNEVGEEMLKNKKLLFSLFDPTRQFGFLRYLELDIKI